MRSLLFVIWIKAEKDVSGVVNLLEDLALAQFDVVTKGGARIVNASAGGKSFSYQLPRDWGVEDFTESIRTLYKEVTTGSDSTSGGQMTNSELQSYVLDSDNEVSDVLVARLTHGMTGRI